jgi:glycosyltransferase involved in cell wall biosynthesis
MKITVVITSFNRPDLLGRALNSLLSQSFMPYEVIIIDDASDCSLDFCLHSQRYQILNIRLHQKNKRSGAPNSRNIGADMAMGDYLTFLDDDDYFLPHRLSLFASSCDFQKHILYSSLTGVQSKIGSISKFKGDESGVYGYNDFLSSCVNGISVIGKTSLFRKYSFDETLECAQDWELWLRILKNESATLCKLDSISYIVNSSPSERITTRIGPHRAKAYEFIMLSYGGDMSQKAKNMMKCRILESIPNLSSVAQLVPFLFVPGTCFAAKTLAKRSMPLFLSVFRVFRTSLFRFF